MIAEHQPPGHRESQLNTANLALAQIRDLETRLAAEKLSANETGGGQNPKQDSRRGEDQEVLLGPGAGDSSASSKGRHWVWIWIILFVFWESRFGFNRESNRIDAFMGFRAAVRTGLLPKERTGIRVRPGDGDNSLTGDRGDTFGGML